MKADTKNLKPRADQGMPEQYLTTEEVAQWLRVAPKTLRNWRSAGLGPPGLKLHGFVRYERAAVEAWVVETSQEAV